MVSPKEDTAAPIKIHVHMHPHEHEGYKLVFPVAKERQGRIYSHEFCGHDDIIVAEGNDSVMKNSIEGATL